MRLHPLAGRAGPYVIAAAAACYLYYDASRIEYSARPGTLGPDFWPKLILVLVIVTCIFEIIKIAVLHRSDQIEGLVEAIAEKTAPEPMPELPERATTVHPRALVGGIALTVAYVALVQALGFFSATVPYLAAFIAIGGYRRWGVIAASSILGTLLMLFFFMKVVYVSLPLGRGPFQQVTLWLMQIMGIR